MLQILGIRIPAVLLASLSLIGATGAAAQQVTNFCTAAPNSSGTWAAVNQFGSLNATANSFGLRCINLPQRKFGFFIVSSAPTLPSTPANSSGNLCISPQFGRLNSTVLRASTSGEVFTFIDLTTIPTPFGTTTVDPGETFYFQFWFRDTVPGSLGDVTTNFSDAISVQFAPSPPTFNGDIWPTIINAPNAAGVRCNSCHSGASPSAGLSMASSTVAYNQLVNIATSSATCAGAFRVRPNSPSQSAILNLLSTASCSATNMTPPSQAASLDLLTRWIDAGAPRN